MKIEWDEDKRQRVLRQRGVDLARAALILEGETWVEKDKRHAYGETRYTATGEFEGEYFTIVYTQREDVFRIITAWRAGRRARRRHQERYGRGAS
jgi:uncharacterized DUF497 family protein